MIDFDHNRECVIYKELSEEKRKYWFDYKKTKNLRNVDNLYYTVKLKENFLLDTKDPKVLSLRSYFEKKKSELLSGSYESVPFFLPDFGNLNLIKRTFQGIYKYWLECPDFFSIIIAPVVPHSADGDSVTPEIYVQIRSYLIWMYGLHEAFQKSYAYVQAIIKFFGLSIDFVTENRIDFCWHTNYFLNPEKYFNPESIFKRQVSRFKGFFFHAVPIGSENYTVDYVAAGKKGNGLFFRIYNKTKEVIELGYKSWFFDVWLLSGLINHYDYYCYELAYKFESSKFSKFDYLNIARLHWYLENGSDDLSKETCSFYIHQYEKYHLVGDDILKFVDKITPKLNMIVNVEYALGRRLTKTFDFVPFHHITNKRDYKEASRVYDVMDNGYILGNFLLEHIFKLVEGSDSHKYRRPLSPFWASLVRTKSFDFKKTPSGAKLKRIHLRELNEEKIRKKVISSMVSLSLYHKGINDDDFSQDFIDTMGLTFNDNDLAYGNFVKKRRINTLSPDFKKLERKQDHYH